MPKATDTRRDRAKKLLELIKCGPSTMRENPGLAESYDLWAKSWILRELVDLVPELCELRDRGNKCKHCGKRPQVVKDTESHVPGAHFAVCTVACRAAKQYSGATRRAAVSAWNEDNPEPEST